MKTCSKCKTEKPITEFSKDASKRSGRQSICKSCHNIDGAKWQKANPEKTLAAGAKYRAANREKQSEYAARRRAANPEMTKKSPEASRITSHNYRARKIANGGKLSRGIAERLRKLQKGKCACCKKPLGEDYHLDHIMPLALGGANEDWNIQLLRGECNLRKRAKHPVDFMRQRGFLL